MDEELKTISPNNEVVEGVESSSAHNETDDLSSSTEIGPTELLYKPSKSDIIPLVLLLVGTALCLVGGLVSHFVVKNQEFAHAQEDFKNSVGLKGENFLTGAIQSTRVTISDITALFSVTNGSVTQFDQFIPFINSTGSFPPNLARFYYQQYVKPGTQQDFIANLRASNPIYSNYAITARNASNSPIPDNCTQAYCLPTTLVAPVLAQSLSLLGFNHYSDPARVSVINRAISTRKVAASQQIIAATTSGPPLSGSLQYSPAFNKDGELLGVLSAVFQNSFLIYNAVQSLTASDCYVSVYDLNATDDLHIFMFNTKTWNGDSNPTNPMTPEEDRALRESAIFHYNATLQFGDRIWVASFVPLPKFLEAYSNSFSKWIGIIVMVCAWLILVGMCVFLFFYGRLRASLQAREASQRRIVALGKFQPKDFLRIVRAVNQAQYVAGKHRNVRITLMSVELGSLDNQREALKSEEIMNLMNEFYEYVKGSAKQNDGFIHACDKTGFTLLFTNEQKAFNVSVMIHRFPRSAEIPIHIAIHSDKALIGLVGDNESLHGAVLSAELETLRMMTANCRKYNRRTVLSQPVLESVKKSCEKNAVYAGSITTTNNTFMNMFEVLGDNDETRLATKENYGSAMENLFKHDYLAALTQLQAVLDIDPMDDTTRELRDSVHMKLKVCKSAIPSWNVIDTLNEASVLRPTFELFMESEKSTENMSMWKEILEFKSASPYDRRRIAAEIFDKYCVQMDMNLNQNTIDTISSKIKGEAPIEGDLFNFVLSELELLMSDTHNRFKGTRAFVNGLCRVITEQFVV